MHPIPLHELARARQADLLAEADRYRRATLAERGEDAPKRPFRLRLRRRARLAPVGPPALGRPGG